MNVVGRPPIPTAYEFLYQKARYKVVKGGRGKAASWSFARVLVDLGHTRKLRILCTREVQNSIKDSVYQLLVDQIHLLGYTEFYHIGASVIRHKITGTTFIFRGLNDFTVSSIKSIEGINIIWVAEAHNMGAKSWRILTPTIRAGGSEIWVDYNPEEEDGATHQKFTVSPPSNSIVRHINYDQNPYFPPELEQERQDDFDKIAMAPNEEARLQAELDYNNVWLGHPRKIGMASILGGRCVFEDFETPNNVHFMHGGDWGYADDPNALVRCFESEDQTILYIDRESVGYGVELDEIPDLFDAIPTARSHKIYADSSMPSVISHVKKKGFDIEGAEKWPGSVEDGIKFLKAYKKIVIHKTNCPNMVSEAKLYSWKVDKHTKKILPIIIDAHNHGWDAVRYALWRRIKNKKKGFFD